jgi:hypothetical protein
MNEVFDVNFLGWILYQYIYISEISKILNVSLP